MLEQLLKTLNPNNQFKYVIHEKGLQVYYPNDYGISVAFFPGSYGYYDNLFEVAVLIKKDNNYCICYNTHITEDVIGYCNEEDVLKIANQIQRLY